MGTDEAVSESHCKAYGPNSWTELHSQATSYLQKIVVTLAPFGGLSSNALAHLRDEWITWKKEFVKIRVPPRADCNQWKLHGGKETSKMPPLVRRKQPCHYCRNHGDTDGFENRWTGCEESEPRRYTATLHRDLAKPAVNILTETFNTWDRPEIAATPVGIRRAALQLTDEDKSTFAYSKLLRTGVSLYCHYGLSRRDIAGLTPYTKRTVNEIECATPEVTHRQNNSYTYLRAVANNEPVSVSTLDAELERKKVTIRQALNKLEERNRVKADKSKQTYMWSTVGDWRAPFTCDVCGFNSATLVGIQSHRRSHD